MTKPRHQPTDYRVFPVDQIVAMTDMGWQAKMVFAYAMARQLDAGQPVPVERLMRGLGAPPKTFKVGLTQLIQGDEPAGEVTDGRLNLYLADQIISDRQKFTKQRAHNARQRWGEKSTKSNTGGMQTGCKRDANGMPPTPTPTPSVDREETNTHSTANDCGAEMNVSPNGCPTADDDDQPPKPNPKPRTRGHRLPEDWELSPGAIAFAKSQGLTDAAIENCLAEFRDHWRSIPGERGRKLDWDATWRNRVRAVISGGPQRTRAAPARRPSGASEREETAIIIATAAGLIEPLDQRDDGNRAAAGWSLLDNPG